MGNRSAEAASASGRWPAEVCTLVSSRLASRTLLRRISFSAILAASLFVAVSVAPAIELSQAESMRIGRKIWQNECGGTISGLTSWNTGENFASLGIGHFIWYPKGVRGPFEESFPHYAAFASGRGATLPPVVAANKDAGCPWSTRAEFLAATDSGSMKELRKFLADTIGLQADFLVQRLKQALTKMLARVSSADRSNVQRQFDQVASTSQGCYALVDYVNFKGEGLLDTERYHGQGWGLLQVLQGMTGNKEGAAAAQEFAASAARVLKQRVQDSPPDRKESRWLAGWLQRVNTYAH